jgi:precorrin-6B methylase 2
MKMKNLAKNLVERTAGNRLAWFAYRMCGRASRYLGQIYGHARWTRETNQRDELLASVVDDLFPDLTVASGPFQGMRYPRERSIGSALLPKLLGSYEAELHPALEAMLTNNYAAVVDVGCAEGYYAVGLGLRLKAAQIYAFDTDPRARQACAEMARLNGVSDRVHIGAMCDDHVLRSLPLLPKALIIADCEGYEKELFTPQAREVLTKHDLIIETHDFIDINISQQLWDAFSGSHQIQSIKSTDDIEKVHRYKYERIAKHDANQRRMILGERRPAIMEWLVMTPHPD